MAFSGTGTGIQNADDVLFDNVSTGDIIKYDTDSQKWNNAPEVAYDDSALTNRVTATEGDITALDTRVDALETTGLFYTSDYPTIQDAVDAAEAAGGGTVAIASGTYDETILLTANVPIEIAGYGATLRASANSQKIITIDRTWGQASVQCVIRGLTLDGRKGTYTGTTGIHIDGTDRAWGQDLRFVNCDVGFDVTCTSAGGWAESCGLADSYFVGTNTCTRWTAGVGTGSCYGSFLRRVEMGGPLSIDIGPGCNFGHSTFDAVKIWLVDNETGVRIAGIIEECSWQIHLEVLPEATPAGCVGVELVTGYAGVNSHNQADLHLTFYAFEQVGATRVLDTLGDGNGIAYWQGSVARVSHWRPFLQFKADGQSDPQYSISRAGIDLGTGNSGADVRMSRSAAGALAVEQIGGGTGSALRLQAADGTMVELTVVQNAASEWTLNVTAV
jgi:hypothetical protein